MPDFILVKDIPTWEVVQINPKLMIGGSLYRCPECRSELFIPYGRSIKDYRYCNNCKEPLKAPVV